MEKIRVLTVAASYTPGRQLAFNIFLQEGSGEAQRIAHSVGRNRVRTLLALNGGEFAVLPLDVPDNPSHPPRYRLRDAIAILASEAEAREFCRFVKRMQSRSCVVRKAADIEP